MFLALAGVSGWFVYRRAPTTEGAFIGGAVGGLILLIAFGWLSAIPARILEWWRIVTARFGGDPRDGKRVAIIGTLRGHGELTAPFSRERCVLYSYEIATTDTHDNESTYRVAYEGFAMVPLSIEHGPERTRILARPDIKLAKTRPQGLAVEENAKHFVENTTFAPAPKKSAEEKDLSHTDGHLRVDYQRGPETNLGACALFEKLLRAEVSVCAIGEFRADRRALLAPVTLRTGTSFGIGAAWRVVNAAIACAIFTAFALVALTLFCVNFPIDAAEQSHPQRTVDWWEVDLERLIQKHVRMPLAEAGMLSTQGFYLQQLCIGCAKGRLEIGGRTLELKHAAYTGGRSVHLSAKPGDRDGVTLDGRDRVVLTIDGKSADVPASWLLPNDIVTALGSEGEYEGRVTVIAPDGWIRCRVSFNTRVDEDAWLVKRN
ncbi:MAG TPA: hypothetical protein VE974_26980 [Thermoanaerobaculia bacterium]|nr:hypothetical protein [Thermoanaerobaculia bacterium]